jgi:hypothetical protein
LNLYWLAMHWRVGDAVSEAGDVSRGGWPIEQSYAQESSSGPPPVTYSLPVKAYALMDSGFPAIGSRLISPHNAERKTTLILEWFDSRFNFKHWVSNCCEAVAFVGLRE